MRYEVRVLNELDDCDVEVDSVMNSYFSDRELGKKELKSEEITRSVYNGIINLFNEYERNFSRRFPEGCPDNRSLCYGTNLHLLYTAIEAEIPNLETPLSTKISEWEKIDKYATLDLVEFGYRNISDVEEGNLHNYFNHYHLVFPESENAKQRFRESVNHIFERNGIVFYLDSDGMIKRHLPTELDNLLQHLDVKSSDSRLNELVDQAVRNIRSPKEENRAHALEKIWDAFERLKTFYDPNNKKQSATTLVKNVAGETEEFNQLLNDEFTTLTSIGNKYQIRHFEKNKIQIKSLKQVDYLFYRVTALIDLCMDKINNESS
ncbi:AbiJ-NTD4 domain-containing protein [Alicyclobacillus sp. ALC3]|uniref:AbiJ-NTD4 domain-containing protein n=1 Tax=Alicyclobacillus sp. ALC3 TaxID=2796143 RepID=UPI002379AF99|nr:hypothetical protein [Alicyclobacillus sp. ALC3]WDL98832.1 hypothetical protein JC200_09360 [Alicyclobacillus sp. ALC3]